VTRRERYWTIVGWDSRSFVMRLRNANPFRSIHILVASALPSTVLHYYPDYFPRIPEKIRARSALVASHQLSGNPIAAVYPAATLRAGSCSCSGRGKVLLDFSRIEAVPRSSRYGKIEHASGHAELRHAEPLPYTPREAFFAHPTTDRRAGPARFGLIVVRH